MPDLGCLVIVDSFNSIDFNINSEEMKLLCESAGVNIVDICAYKRNYIDSNFYIGKGQAQNLSDISFELNTNVIIFSEDLSPTQIRNLENLTNKRIVDRTQLILDIFARRAQSNEGKIQVELAQLEYLLPRLTGKGIELSRIGGGSGVATRGPGETKLETDKRKIKEKIAKLKKELLEIQKQRNISGKNRIISQIPSVSLIGYTSAGKSTLLSKLANEDFYTDQMLFATLDTVTRKIDINKNNSIYLSDTVGFLQKLPHNLIAAFKSTLSEISNADILLHIIDSTKKNINDDINTVNDVLEELKISKKSIIYVFNKIDIADKSKLQELYYNFPKSVFISAKTGLGIESLLKIIENTIQNRFLNITILLPYNYYNTSLLYKYGKIYKTDYLENGIYIEAKIPKEIYYYYQDFTV